jgi:PAS domain S-box-containing protein
MGERDIFERLFEQSRDGIAVIRDGEIRLANETLCELLGYSKAELADRPFVELLPPEERERVQYRHEARLRGEDLPDTYEITVLTNDGTDVPVEISVGELQYEGEPAFVTILRDVTERRKRERILRRANRQIRRQETILSRLHEVTRELMRAESRSDVATLVVEAVEDALGFPYTAVRFYDGADRELVPVAVTEHGVNVGDDLPAYDLDGGVPGDVYDCNETWVCDDVTEIETAHGPDDVRSVMHVPLVGQGLVSIGATETSTFDDTDVRLAELLAANATVALDHIDFELELERARKRLTEAQRLANVGHWDWNVETGTLEWSDEMYRILGLEPGEVEPTYDAFFEYVHPEDREALDRAVSEALAGGDYDVDHRIVRPDGEIRIVHERADVTYEHGDPVKMLGTMQDVTSARRMEQLLSDIRRIDKRILQADDESELLASVQAVLSEWNRHGCTAFAILDDDGALEDVYAVGTLDDVAPMTDADWRDVHTDEYIQRALAEGVYVIDDVTEPPHAHHPTDVERHGAAVFALSYRGHDYGVLTLHLSPAGLTDEECRLLEDVASDIAAGIHALRSERRIERENEELALLNRIVRHDIRNDMTVVLGFAELLAEKLPDDEQADVDRIIETSRHTVELTRTARDLVEMTRGDDRPETEPVALDAAVADEVANAARSFPHATFDVEDVPDVRVQANDLLPAVFRNLLHNAVQHNNTAEPHVEVTATRRDGRVVVHVADDGPGIPDDRKEEIFGKGEKGLDSPGTGMGLYLVRTLADWYGGRVWVDDNEPTGAIFNVELRVAESAA